ncbi:hypothetical protein G9447_14650 [Actinopolyspora sp. BKK1]|uniref:protein phosphatase 2C domain-containing protein n=1 Tax=Actinopolyspora sp. BKK2 TaxID=2599395 RepID=UPI0013F5E64F|nr:protein phosphatase 2C domain-containing protein [Actinopolyspora sp. BKK2]NHD19498.1 hypothetical protein [Actinopolyspora sp. BKK2]NHE77438.1 hypothetical protein [Actinopolyspora sp. BKK1]
MARTKQKKGRAWFENEDAHAGNAVLGRYAVSDGASTAARSEIWSRLLTRSFVWEQQDPLCAESLAELRARWWNAVSGTALPWYARAKLLEGSAATFLGLFLGAQEFHARAVGDSCLLHLRGSEILTAGPLERAEQFNRSPPLMYTHPSREVAEGDVWVCEGDYQPDDTFVLATDAAAKCLLRHHERDGTVSPLPEPGERAAAFHDRIDDLRATGELDNDDTTVCVIRT